MEDDFISQLSGLDPSLLQGPSVQERNEQVDKNEFIMLLVTQLQNQDPLDPMANEEFAVQLAQFSQVEELIAIKEQLKESSGGDFSSMASYLGHEITINSDLVDVKNGDGGSVKFELESDAATLTLELLDGNGVVKETISLGSMSAGKQTVELSGLGVENGEYAVQVSGLSGTGIEMTPVAYAAGIVSGFVPGPEPQLIIGNREVSPDEIREVNVVGQV